MPPTNLQSLDESAALAEGLLLRWFKRLDATGMTPTLDLLNEGVNTLSRLTAIRKSLTLLSNFNPAPTNNLLHDFADWFGVQASACPENTSASSSNSPSPSPHQSTSSTSSTSSTTSTPPLHTTFRAPHFSALSATNSSSVYSVFSVVDKSPSISSITSISSIAPNPHSALRIPQSSIRTPYLRGVAQVPVLPRLSPERIQTELARVHEALTTGPMIAELPPEPMILTRHEDGSFEFSVDPDPQPRPPLPFDCANLPPDHPFLHPELEEAAIRRANEIYARNKKKKNPG
jgi:hypothetical protein